MKKIQSPDTNPMPEIKLFDPFGRIREMLGKFSLLPNETFASHGDHFVRGAEEMLGEHLDESNPAFEQLAWQFDKDSRQ